MQFIESGFCRGCDTSGPVFSVEYEDTEYDLCYECYAGFHPDVETLERLGAAIAAHAIVKQRRAQSQVRDESLGKFLAKTTAKGLAQQIREDNDN